LQNQVGSLSQSNAELQRELDKARKSLDRQRMEHDKARTEWADLDSIRKRESGTPGIGKSNGSGHATPNGKTDDVSRRQRMDEDVKLTMQDVKPAIPGPSGDVQLQDTSELEKIAASRLKELESLRAKYTALRQEHDRLKVETCSPTEEVIRESAFFQVYLQRLAYQQSRADDLEQHVALNDKKLDDLRQTNGDFRDAVVNEARQEIDALRQLSSKKDQDSARLRGQRDEIQAELTERTAREAEKMQSLEEFEMLANTRQERINFLSSEVRRLKGQLAARDGSEGYLAFLKADGGIDGDYVADLESKVSYVYQFGTEDCADKQGCIRSNRFTHLAARGI
jgi:E3 ubiquitin-protein ligase BRE1